MGLQDIYKRFLAYPSGEALTSDAAIHYLPTLSSIHEPLAILKHFTAQDQQLKKKDEKFLNVIETSDSLCIETETTIQFLQGGGTYLPGLDDNFLADRIATFPLVHIVTFNAEQKIRQIRLFWDQGSLLKAIDVIGSRGRNWPIRDGKEMSRLVQSSVSAAPRPGSSSGDERAGRRQSRVGANGDPHNSLQLFKAREFTTREDSPNEVAPRPAATPAPRDYHDLFAAGADVPPERSPSPRKNVENHVKGGAGKNFQENRLFDDTVEDSTISPKKSIITHPKKYEHFEFGEAKFTSNPQPLKASKHASQWNFEDFVTPQKPKAKSSPRDERHFGWSEDEEEAKKPDHFAPHVPKPRQDAAPHFEFTDSTPKAEPRPSSSGKSRHASHASRGNDLYEDHITNTTGTASSMDKMPLGNITNQAQHRKNFSSQFEMTDDSPHGEVKDENRGFNRSEPMKKHNTNSNWSLYDDSPPPTKGQGIKIGGDGMGGSRNPTEKGWWEYGDE